MDDTAQIETRSVTCSCTFIHWWNHVCIVEALSREKTLPASHFRFLIFAKFEFLDGKFSTANVRRFWTGNFGVCFLAGSGLPFYVKGRRLRLCGCCLCGLFLCRVQNYTTLHVNCTLPYTTPRYITVLRTTRHYTTATLVISYNYTTLQLQLRLRDIATASATTTTATLR